MTGKGIGAAIVALGAIVTGAATLSNNVVELLQKKTKGDNGTETAPSHPIVGAVYEIRSKLSGMAIIVDQESVKQGEIDNSVPGRFKFTKNGTQHQIHLASDSTKCLTAETVNDGEENKRYLKKKISLDVCVSDKPMISHQLFKLHELEGDPKYYEIQWVTDPLMCFDLEGGQDAKTDPGRSIQLYKPCKYANEMEEDPSNQLWQLKEVKTSET